MFWDISTNTYDVHFINTIKQFFSNKIRAKVHATVAELREDYTRELRDTGIAQVDLEDEDVERVISILIYDGDVEPVITSTAVSTVYRPSYLTLPSLGVAEVPCIRCPVAHACSDTGDISPASCQYLQKWLEF